jgi:hypothetical protein
MLLRRWVPALVSVVGALTAAPLAFAEQPLHSSRATSGSGPLASGRMIGSPILPPPAPSSRELAGFQAYEHTLIALRRGRGGERLLRHAGGELLSGPLAVWSVSSAKAVRLVPLLQARGALRYAEPDRPIDLVPPLQVRQALPFGPADHLGDPLVGYQWWLETIGADQAEPPGPGVPLTVVDTGLDIRHPEFARRRQTRVLNRQIVDDYHGTQVAAVAAAPTNDYGIVGVYPRARLRAYDAGGAPNGTFTNRDLFRGIVKALTTSSGRGVINMSFGSRRFSAAIRDAIWYAFAYGVIPVAAAGNDYKQGNPLEFPASLNHVLTVAATDVRDNPSPFSNSNFAVDLAAPGGTHDVDEPWDERDILVPSPDYRYFEPAIGTSYAAPMVAAATSWVWTRRPRLDYTQIFNLMRFSARDVREAGYDPDTGFGILDIPSALTETPPIRDPGQEPNDDIYLVKRNGLFEQATRPITRAGKRRALLRALLDFTEDPVDVYRAWIPPGRSIWATLRPNADVDLKVYQPWANTVYRLRGLIDASDRPGTRTEVVGVQNSGRRGVFVYVVAYLAPGVGDAYYRLGVRTTR